MKKLLLLLTCLCVMQSVCYAYDDILNVEVGESFTVYGESHTHIQAVLWDYDPDVFETVSVSGYSTRGKFKAISPSPSAGSVIQATIYYYRDGTTSSGVNKAVSSWKVYVADDGSESTVSLLSSLEMEVGETATISATTSSSKYSGNFSWSSDNPSNVDIISERDNTATLRAYSAGNTYIHVTLDNGNSDKIYVTVNEELTPTVTAYPSSGTYQKGTKIYLCASESNATIRYTTDGSTPTASSQEYCSYLTLTEPFTLKARAYNSSGTAGEVLTCNYTMPESIDISYNILSSSDKTVEVVDNKDGYKYEGDIVIPEKVKIEGTTYTVVQIGVGAFSDCSNLTSITIPNSVTIIGQSAFRCCSNLTSITIPNSVTIIGQSAFMHCSSLTSITIPNSVTKIGEQVFRYCSNLTSITIPNSVTSIGYGAFYGCSSLTSITIPNSVATIEKYAFGFCDGLNSITIPNSVTTIGDYAFSGCRCLTGIDVDIDNPAYLSDGGILYDKLRTTLLCCPGGKTGEVIIPNSVTTIEEYAFRSCGGLTSVIIPNSVTTIEEYAFRYCGGLTSVIIPNSVTTIEEYAFSDCSSLTSVIIPNSVTTIEEYAFDNCSSLTSITIPNSVTTIGDDAFYGCSSLTSITSLAVTPPECGNNVFSYRIYRCTLYVPAGCKEAYQQALVWQDCNFVEELETVLVYEIRLNETVMNMIEGSTFQLTAEVLPADATDKTLQWESSDASCVTVDSNGLLTAVAQGSATITVQSADGNAAATCAVKVLPTTGIESVEAGTGAIEVFILTGAKVADSLEGLPAGIYLVRQGSAVRKVVIK